MSLGICLHCTEYKSHQPYAQSVFMMWLVSVRSFIFAYHVAVSEELYGKQLNVYTTCCILLNTRLSMLIRISSSVSSYAVSFTCFFLIRNDTDETNVYK